MTMHAKGRPNYVFLDMTEVGGRRVFSRPLPDGGLHLLIEPLLFEGRPDWYTLLAIKSLIAGPDRQAVEIFPPDADVVDDGPMAGTHLWVLPVGQELPYTLPKRPRRFPMPATEIPE